MRGLRMLGLVVAAAVGCLVLAPLAGAKTYVVTRHDDPNPGPCLKNDCSLREAVRAANAHAGADIIRLPSTKRYNLSRPSSAEDGAMDGDLDITNAPLTIVHPGKGRATIDANAIDRVFDIFTGAPTTLKKLKITGGKNASGGENDGAGIQTNAKLRIFDSAIVGNHANGFDASGGGIQANGGTLLIVRSSISYNRADDTSGAFDVGNHGVTIQDSTIVGNRAGFAGVSYMYGDGKSLIERTTIAKNRSESETGTIYFSESAGSIRILRSTISGNTAVTDGGGFSARNGTVFMSNTTIAGNRAGGDGGGLWALTPTKLNSVTIARNVADSNNAGGEGGGGIWKATSGFLVEVSNSIVALNKLGSGAGNDCSANEIDSLGHNLISTTSSCFGFDAPGDKVRANPKLGQLKSNGGPTKTIKLLPGSPAINAAAASSPSRDQRGVKRGKKPDIGAFELYAR